MIDDMSLFRAIAAGPEGGDAGALAEGYLPAVVTGSMARLDVPDHLGDEALPPEHLAAAVGADAGALRRLLAAAAVYGLVGRDDTGRFRLTPTGACLRREAPDSVRDLTVGFCWRFAPLWEGTTRLVEAVRTGKAAEANDPAHTMAQFSLDPAEAAGFARALGVVTRVLVGQLQRVGYVPPSGTIVDVGGGTGTLLAGLLGLAPEARGVLVDRAPVLAAAPALLAGAGVADRVDVVAGDFFADVAPGDVHVLCQVLHDWDDQHAGRILERCHAASPPGGALVVVECVLPAGPEPSLAHVMDLMMLMAGSGRERTAEQLAGLAGPVGYASTREVPLGGPMPFRVLEYRKA